VMEMLAMQITVRSLAGTHVMRLVHPP
jgi:hypothetical protein